MSRHHLGIEATSRPYEEYNPAHSPAFSHTTTSTAISYNSSASSSNRASYAKVTTKVKLTVVGDGGVGKTCLLIVYSEDRFPKDYIPTVFETYVTRVPFGENKVIEFALWDTAGQEEYDRLRPLSYPETGVLLVCFACDYPVSLENVEEKWYPEVAHFCEGVPIILVATKTDLRRDQRTLDLLKAQGRTPVTPTEGQAVARRMGAKYAEVSAMRGEGVQEVFELALREAMRGSRGGGGGGRDGAIRRHPKCTIL